MRARTLAAAVLFISSSTFADHGQPKLEITSAFGTGPAGSVGILTGGTNTVTTVGLAGTLGFFVTPTAEIIVTPSLTLVSAANTVTVFAFNAGPLINFSESIADSAFLFAAPGILITDAGNSSTDFQFVIGLGKRIPIVDHVTWSPMVTYTGVAASSYLSGFGITPLQFSLLL